MEESKKEDATVVDAAIADATARTAAGDLAGAVERLLAAEKKTRTGGDSLATSRLAVAIVRLCWQQHDLKALNANILVISKRRGQLKQAIADVVTEAMTFLDSMSDSGARVELITTLRTVTEGKIYVEAERARLTRKLAAIREAEGKISEASETLQEVTVETYGSMDKREKADFLLEQVRLTLAQGDFVRMGILAAKVNAKVLDEAGLEDLRLRYYDLRHALNQHRRDAYAMSKDFQAVMKTNGYAADAAKWTPALASAIVYLILSPYSHEVDDMMHRLKADKRTEELPSFRALLNFMTTDELVPWPLPAPHHEVLRAHAAFAIPAPTAAAAAASSSEAAMEVDAPASSVMHGISGPRKLASSVVRKEDEGRTTWWDVFHKRIVQHNVRVLAKWYTRLPASRCAELLSLNADTTEAVLSELISDKAIYGRIDRPAGVITFAKPREAAQILSDWSADMDTVLTLVEKTAHMVQKEYMVKGMTQRL